MNQEFIDRLEAAKEKFRQVGLTRAKYFIPALEEMILETADKGARQLSWITTELSDVPPVALDALLDAMQDHFGQTINVTISSDDEGGRHNVQAEW
jgi:hypothetical protein